MTVLELGKVLRLHVLDQDLVVEGAVTVDLVGLLK